MIRLEKKMLRIVLLIPVLILLSSCDFLFEDKVVEYSANIKMIINNRSDISLNCVISYSYKEYKTSYDASGDAKYVAEYKTFTEYYNNLGPRTTGEIYLNVHWEELISGYDSYGHETGQYISVEGVPLITGGSYYGGITVMNGQTGTVEVILK